MNPASACSKTNESSKTNGKLFVGSAEWRLLINTARLELDNRRAKSIRQILREKVNWDAVIQHSGMHGTAGLLFRHLSALGPEAGVPEWVLVRLHSNYLRTIASNLQQLSQFQAVAKALTAAGIEFILLKGAVLVDTLYGDLGLRPLSDVDVIVKEEDWPEICNVLKSFRYGSARQEFSSLPPKLTRYDVRAHIQFLSPIKTSLEFQFDLFTLGIGMRDMEGVWRRSREAEVAGVKSRILGPEDQLLHLVVHANRHGCSRLKWLVDIAETLRHSKAFNWDEVVSIAHCEKVKGSVYPTLAHVQRLFEERLIDARVMARLAPRIYQRVAWKVVWPRKQLDEFRGRYEDAICFYFYRPFSGWNLLNFILMGRVWDKLAYQGRWFMPSLSWMAQTYSKPRSLKLLRYYPARVRERLKKKDGLKNAVGKKK
jgi:hypothetical protein